MRLRRSSKFVGLSLGALLLTLGLIFIAKTRWEHQQLMQALDPYVKGLVSFKLSRSDNQHQYYIEDLVQIQVSQEATELVIVRHIPRNDQLHLRIEKAELQPNKTVMLLTHRSGNLCRIYLQ